MPPITSTPTPEEKYKGNIIEVSPVEFISITINGGYNGIDQRKKYYALSRSVLI